MPLLCEDHPEMEVPIPSHWSESGKVEHVIRILCCSSYPIYFPPLSWLTLSFLGQENYPLHILPFPQINYSLYEVSTRAFLDYSICYNLNIFVFLHFYPFLLTLWQLNTSTVSQTNID